MRIIELNKQNKNKNGEKKIQCLTGFSRSRFLLHVDNNRLNCPIFHDDDSVTERLLQVKAYGQPKIYALRLHERLFVFQNRHRF